jgi:hypothetical protein
MRTFSLIWSGIGCFATVAITVLSGAILTRVNNSFTYTVVNFDSVLIIALAGFDRRYHIPVKEFVSFSDVVINDYAPSSFYYFFDSEPFTVIVILKEGYTFLGFAEEYGNFDVSFYGDYNVAVVNTITGINAFGATFRSGDVYYMHNADATVYFVYLYVVFEETHIVTSHISPE